jgi:hypothetical protein
MIYYERVFVRSPTHTHIPQTRVMVLIFLCD